MQIAIESDCPIMAWLFINVKWQLLREECVFTADLPNCCCYFQTYSEATLVIFWPIMKVKNCCSNSKQFRSRGENYFNWGRKWTTRTWRHFPLVFSLEFSFSFCLLCFSWSCHEWMPTPLHFFLYVCSLNCTMKGIFWI